MIPRKGWTKATPKTFEAYLAALSPDKRAALERLRRTIHNVVPGVEECVSYSLPAFRLNGKLIAGLGASAYHCSYFPMSGSVVDALRKELMEYDTSVGTIRFQPEKPLPVSLVRRLLRIRIAEITSEETRLGTGPRRK
jgi:uncharacterized protein YdhG (YjbR/CyaY superfamily)